MIVSDIIRTTQTKTKIIVCIVIVTISAKLLNMDNIK